MNRFTAYMMVVLLAGLMTNSCTNTDNTACFQRFADEVTLNAEGDAVAYYIRVSGEWYTEIENGSEWIQISPASGNGNGELISIMVSSSQKTTGISIEGTFYLCGQGHRFPVRVTQSGDYFRMVKQLPRLVVLDWGEYAKGTGTNGYNGTERAFTLELAYTETGAAIRKYETTRSNWLVSGQFHSHNRFGIGGLEPDTDYVFRMTPLGASFTAVGKFHTPAEPVQGDNILVYKDFDTFWWGGCPIYQAYGIQPSQDNIGNLDLDPADPAVWLRSNDPCVNPVNSTALYFNFKNASAADSRSPLKCPKYWNYCWEGDKYGTNYGDESYPGWTGYNVRHCTGSILLGTASAGGYICTPYLTALGPSSATVVVTVNSAAYYESYHSNYAEDNLRHQIRVEGAGTILDGGSTCKVKEEKQVIVECSTNVANQQTLQPMYDINYPTTHTVTISGADSSTRIVIESITATKNRFWIDDIKIEKQ